MSLSFKPALSIPLLLGLLTVVACGASDKNDGREPDTGERSQPEGAFPGECDDGADNDFDGDFDCNDADCGGSPDCIENFADGDCSDGADNDRDGLFDCDDPDCADDAACATEDDCTDGADNDLDGLIDCDDPDCAENAACIEYEGDDAGECADGIDNDSDGLVDCNDPDCEGSPDCESTAVDQDGDGVPAEEDCDDTNSLAYNDNGASEDCAALSCKDILDRQYSTGDGTYWIDPDGTGVDDTGTQTTDTFEAFCDMTTDGGGWTLIAQGGSRCSSSGMSQSNSVTDGDSCGYLAYSQVSQIASISTNVMLQAGNNSNTFGDWTNCVESGTTSSTNCSSVSLNSLAVDGLLSATGTWHNGSTWSNWDWSHPNSPTPGATGWPNMYHSSDNVNGVHWLATNTWLSHQTNAQDDLGLRNIVSATWLR